MSDAWNGGGGYLAGIEGVWSSVRAAYEVGYGGFWLYRKLVAAGIDCIVLHPASIEVSSRDTVKTDKRDSLKIAQQLAAGRLQCVSVPTKEYAQGQKRLSTGGLTEAGWCPFHPDFSPRVFTL